MGIAVLWWQATSLLFALISLTSFLPLLWVGVHLPTHRAALLLALLTPILLVIALLLYYPLFLTMQIEHQHLNNELNGFMVVLVPTLTALGASVLNILDVVRRRAWGWLALVVVVPWLGSLVYGFAGRRAQRQTRPESDTIHLGAFLLAGATLALLSVIAAIFVVVAGTDGIHCGCSTPNMLSLFGASVAVVTGVSSGFALLLSRPARAAALLIPTCAVAAQLISGTTFPRQDPLAPTYPPNIVVHVLGFPGTETIGAGVTLALTALLALLQVVMAIRVAPRTSQ